MSLQKDDVHGGGRVQKEDTWRHREEGLKFWKEYDGINGCPLRKTDVLYVYYLKAANMHDKGQHFLSSKIVWKQKNHGQRRWANKRSILFNLNKQAWESLKLFENIWTVTFGIYFW